MRVVGMDAQAEHVDPAGDELGRAIPNISSTCGLIQSSRPSAVSVNVTSGSCSTSVR